MLIAIPLGIGTGAFISEYAGKIKIFKACSRNACCYSIVAIGFLGSGSGSRNCRTDGAANGLNALNGAVFCCNGIAYYCTIAEDAINAVPASYREASYGVARWQTLVFVTIPAAAPGIIAAIMLSRKSYR